MYAAYIEFIIEAVAVGRNSIGDEALKFGCYLYTYQSRIAACGAKGIAYNIAEAIATEEAVARAVVESAVSIVDYYTIAGRIEEFDAKARTKLVIGNNREADERVAERHSKGIIESYWSWLIRYIDTCDRRRAAIDSNLQLIGSGLSIGEEKLAYACCLAALVGQRPFVTNRCAEVASAVGELQEIIEAEGLIVFELRQLWSLAYESLHIGRSRTSICVGDCYVIHTGIGLAYWRNKGVGIRATKARRAIPLIRISTA